MPNIRLDLSTPIYDGQALTFKSPADCSAVTGLIVYYPDIDSTLSKVFLFADAHGNNIGHLDLFASDSLVKIILDTESSLAFVQNADTNAYLESKFAKSVSMKTSEVVLTVSGWSNNTQTVNVDGVTATVENNAIIPTPAFVSDEEYHECGVKCSAQLDGKLTFICKEVPTNALTVNVLILTKGV